jgi:hypothetical protein
MWVGVLGAGLSWALMFLFGYGLSVGSCNRLASGHIGYIGSAPVPFRLWTLIATIVGAALAVLGIAAAIVTFRATRSSETDLTSAELAGEGSAPPIGRLHFMSIIGMVISPLFLCIILVSGLGAFVLEVCTQA